MVTYIKNIFSITDHYLQIMMRSICIGCFSLLLILLAGNVFIRNFPFMSFYWFDEVVELTFAWLVFLGAAKLWAENEHFKLTWVSEKIKSHRTRHIFLIGIEAISIIFLLIFTFQSLQLTILAQGWTPVFNVSKRFLYVCMPISGCIMVGYSLRTMIRELKQLKECKSTHKGSE